MQKINLTSILIIPILICGLNNLLFSQNVATTLTQYSQKDKGEIGKERFSFSMTNGIITIIDLDYNKSDIYKPLKVNSSGFDEKGYYFDTYSSDILDDPAGWARERKKPRFYKFLYDKKNGNVLSVLEVKYEDNDSKSRKTFFTEQGNLVLNNAKKENNLSSNSSSFDLGNILLNATSLAQITTKIILSFTKDGEKKYSTDMSSYSFNYKNESKTSVIITYSTSNDEVTKLFFLMPKEEAVQVGKKSFITNFTQKRVDGNAVWINTKTGLNYEARYNGEVGIIVVSQ